MAGVIRLLLVDDHPVVVGGLQKALDEAEGLEVAATTASLAEARAFLGRTAVDVALVDLRLPDGSGLELLEFVLELSSPPAVLMLTSFDAPYHPQAAAARGASGFLLKTAPLAEIVEAIRIAASGRTTFSPSQIHPTSERAWKPLTARERSIVELVVAGRSNDEISAGLGLSPKTVEWYMSRLLARFDVQSRTELATRAGREGWLDLPST